MTISDFPGDYGTFRLVFERTLEIDWEALLTIPWAIEGGWSVLFPRNVTWALAMNPSVHPQEALYGKPVSAVIGLNWGGKIVRVWRLEPLSAKPPPEPMTIRQAWPRALPKRPCPFVVLSGGAAQPAKSSRPRPRPHGPRLDSPPTGGSAA